MPPYSVTGTPTAAPRIGGSGLLASTLKRDQLDRGAHSRHQALQAWSLRLRQRDSQQPLRPRRANVDLPSFLVVAVSGSSQEIDDTLRCPGRHHHTNCLKLHPLDAMDCASRMADRRRDRKRLVQVSISAKSLIDRLATCRKQWRKQSAGLVMPCFRRSKPIRREPERLNQRKRFGPPRLWTDFTID